MLSSLRRLDRTIPEIRIIIYTALAAERSIRLAGKVRKIYETAPPILNLIGAASVVAREARRQQLLKAKISKLQMKIFLKQRAKHHV